MTWNEGIRLMGPLMTRVHVRSASGLAALDWPSKWSCLYRNGVDLLSVIKSHSNSIQCNIIQLSAVIMRSNIGRYCLNDYWNCGRIWVRFCIHKRHLIHYSDVIMSPIMSQITSLTIVYSTVYSSAYQMKHQSSASLAFVRGIHRWLVNSPTKGQ